MDPRSERAPRRGPRSLLQLGALILPLATRVSIHGLSDRGHGLATIDDQLVEIPSTEAGDVVDAVLYPAAMSRGSRRAGFGRALRWHERANTHVDPGCPYAHECPGCATRHLAPRRGLDLKAEVARRRLTTRHPEAPWPALEAREPITREGYRSRAVARALRGPDGSVVLGMLPHPGGALIPLGGCPAQTDRCRALLRLAEAEIRRLQLPPYDPRVDEGLLKAVHAEAGDLGPGRLIFALARAPAPDERVEALLAEHPAPPAVYIDQLPRRGGGLLRAPRHLRGPETMYLPGPSGHPLQADPLAWTPQSPGSGGAVLDALAELLPTAADPALGAVLEIGCGIGTHSLALAPNARQWLGVDHTRAAITSAEANARAAGLSPPQLSFRVGDGAHALRRLLSRGARFEHIVLHGMRTPFGAGLMSLLRSAGARRLVYVTPNAGALAEDLTHLTQWTPTHLVGVDQMPATAHLLVMAAFDLA